MQIKLDPWTQRIVESPHRFLHINFSRRAGKSTGLVIRRALRGIPRKRPQIMVSASKRQAKDLNNKARVILTGCGLLKPSDMQTIEEIRTPVLRMLFFPPNPDTLRGFGGDVAWDEAAHVEDGGYRLWETLFPMVARGEGEFDVSSTPRGVKNKFADLRDNKMFHHMTVTLDDMIAEGSPLNRDDLFDAYGDEEFFQQEFLCKYLDESTAYLTYAMIQKCVDEKLPLENDGPGLIPPDAEIYIGVDLGRSKDLTCFWCAWLDDGILRSHNVIVMSNVSYDRQYSVLHGLLSDDRVRGCAIDYTNEKFLGDLAQKDFGEYRVDLVNFTVDSKGRLAESLRHRVQEQRITIPEDRSNHESIIEDWHRIKRDVTTFGAVRFSADKTKDGHSDRFWAAALCTYAAGGESGCENPVVFV